MKMTTTIALVGLMTVPALAEEWSCDLTREATESLLVHSANFANRNTTRTPEGGSFQPWIVKACANGHCAIERSEKAPVMKYEPDHPDADENGFVAYPNIDVSMERDQAQNAFALLDVAAIVGGCGATLTGNTREEKAYRYSDVSFPFQSIFVDLDAKGLVCRTSFFDRKGLASEARLSKCD